MRRRLASPAFAFLLGLALGTAALTACSRDGDAQRSAPTGSPSSAAPSSATPSPSISASLSPSVTSDGTGRIGGAALALPGGASVKVGAPVRYPSSGPAGTTRTGDTLTVYSVTVTSTGSKPIDMTLTAVNAYARGEQVDLQTDSEHPADNHFSGTLLPGKSMRATFSFLTRKSDTGQMQVEVFVGSTGQAHGVFTDPDTGTT